MCLISRALADLNVVTTREFTLKHKQEVAVRALLDRKDVLAPLPTGYGKNMIHQMFVRAKDYQMNGKATIFIISPLVSIIKDQTQDLKSIGYSAVDVSELTLSEIRQCNCKVMFASAEKVKKKTFRQMLIDQSSPLHHNSSSCLNA